MSLDILSSTTASEAARRRSELARRVGSGLVLLPAVRPVSRAQAYYCYEFRQCSHILYYTGVATAQCAVLMDLDANELSLFVPEMGPEDLVWHDREPSRAELAGAAGAAQAEPPEALEGRVREALEQGRTLHLLHAEDWPGQPVSDALIDAVVDQRLRKSPDEVARIEAAMKVTERAHAQAMAVTRPGVLEAEVQAVVEAVFRANGKPPAYPPIATCQGQVLHANRPWRRLEEGQLFLLDAGAEELNGYTTDVTRTFPVSGRFSDIQAALYDTVLKAQLAGIDACRPGRFYEEVHEAASREIIAGLKELGLLRGDPDELYERDAHALFFPHGVGHLLGLDVHDLEELGEDRFGYADGRRRRTDLLGRRYLRLNRRLAEGFVVTVEPGVYFIAGYLEDPALEARFSDCVDFAAARRMLDFGGLRIEDDILVEATGPRNLSAAIPKERAQVEAAVGCVPTLLAELKA
jgi:Xaa-Pro aminopeptidase